MNNKKEYLAIDNEGLHDYDIIVEDMEDKGVKYSIHMSRGEQYQTHAKGELVLSMTDTGNEIKFNKSLKEMDYSELLCLRILLTVENKLDEGDKSLKYRIVENKPILEV